MHTTDRSTLLGLALAGLAWTSAPAAAQVVTGGSQVQVGPLQPAARQRLPLPGEFNVILIVLDDLGTDQLKMYADDPGPPGYCASTQLDSVRTPNLDALRADGILYTRCYVNPTCSPTRAALMTGRYGRRTGIGHAINPSDIGGHVLADGEVFLPELLAALSPTYRRGAFGKWHMTHYTGDDCHPSRNGFEVFEGVHGNPAKHYAWRKVSSTGGSGSCTGSSTAEIPGVTGLTPDESFWVAGVTRIDTVSWINGLGASPFFAYVNFAPPHAPWEVPPFSTLSALTAARLSYAGLEAGDEVPNNPSSTAKLVYHAMTEAIDYEIDQILTGISPTVLARTMVLIVGDNGTVGEVIHNPALTSHGKRTLYELGTRVPMLVTGPLVGISSMGGTCRNLVEGVDFWRTIANICGVPNAAIDAYMTGTTIDSRSFLKTIITPSTPPARATAYFEAFKNTASPPAVLGVQRGVTDGTYRYIYKVDDFGNPSEFFYHTAADPCEATNLLLGPPLTGADLAAYNALVAAMAAI